MPVRWSRDKKLGWTQFRAGRSEFLGFSTAVFSLESGVVPRSIVGGQGEGGLPAQRSGALGTICFENLQSRADGSLGVVRKKNARLIARLADRPFTVRGSFGATTMP